MNRSRRVRIGTWGVVAALSIFGFERAEAGTVAPLHYFTNADHGGVGPLGLVADTGGALYFLDHLNQPTTLEPQIVGLDPTHGQVTPLLLLPQDSDAFPGLAGIAFSPAGILYGASYSGSQPPTNCGKIESYDIAAGTATTVYSFPCGLSGTSYTYPNGADPSRLLGFDAKGALIGTLSVGAGGTGQGFFKFDPATATTTSFAAGVNPNTHGAVLHPNGLIYTTGSQAVGVNGDMFSVDPASGKVTDLGAIPLSPDAASLSAKFEPAGYDGGLSVDPSGIVWGVGQELVYTTNKHGAKYHNACFVIFKFDPTAGTTTLEQHFPCVYQRTEPVPVFDQTGAMYFDYALQAPIASHPKSQIIYKYVPATNTLSTVVKLGLKKDGYAIRLFVNPDGTLLGLANQGAKLGGGAVIKITP